MSNVKEKSLVELVASVVMGEGFNKEESSLIAKVICSRRDRILKEYSLPGLIPSSTPQNEANEKRAEDLGDPEEMILEIKTALGENYTKEDLLTVLEKYR